MDAFLSQIQPYLDQAQIAAAQLVEAAMANPITTAAFAAVFLLLVFLRRRRRRKNHIADRIISEHETRAADPGPASNPAPARPAPKTEAKVVRAAKPAQTDDLDFAPGSPAAPSEHDAADEDALGGLADFADLFGAE